MRIHLVTPKNPPSFWTYDAILPTLGRRCLCPNLSLPTVAGITPPGHEVTLCDENVEPVRYEVAADVVGITGYIVHQRRMIELAQAFRRRGRLVVAGGPLVTLRPEALRPRVDALFLGEAEETWPRFLADLEAGCAAAEYRAAEPPRLLDSPPPRYDLMQVGRYHVMALQTTRGCPFQCEFCDVIVLNGRRPRSKTPAQVLTEIEVCHRLGARQIFVVDDNFVGNRRNAKQLLREIARWQREQGHPLELNTQGSLNVARDPELLELLRDAGFRSLFVGIESPRRDCLEEVGKVQNVQGDLVESVRTIQRAGIQVQAGMIVGFDHDDATTFEEQVHFLEEAGIPVSMTGMLQALPGTALHARLERERRLVDDSGGDQFVLSNVEPRGMSRTELYRGYRELLRALYDPRRYRRRVMAFLEQRPRRRRRSAARLRPADLRLAARVVRDLLVLGGPRRAAFTLSLALRALRLGPGAVGDALSLAVIHKGLADYVQRVMQALDQCIAELEEGRATPM